VEVDPQNPKKLRARRYKGMLEWILDREGHEFLVNVDRSFIRNEENLFGLLDRVH
jgi:hypothetical protein